MKLAELAKWFQNRCLKKLIDGQTTDEHTLEFWYTIGLTMSFWLRRVNDTLSEVK